MNYWKWSTGELYYKSPRSRTIEEKEQEEQSYDSQRNAINQSLADYSEDSDLINITNSTFLQNKNSSGTRREDIDSKMADREMLAQRGVNPFLQTSYVNDIVTRDMYLKPINTTQGKTKVTSEEE